jgi:uncharacterized membrane protein
MSSWRRIAALCLPAFALLFQGSGCAYRVEKKASPVADTSAIQPTAQQLSQSSFQMVYGKVLQPHCVSCHGNSGGVNLETSSAARSALQKIKEQAIDSRKMPKSPETPLTLEELQMLSAWILTNGRELPADGSPPPPPPPPLEPTFASIKSHIFDLKCIRCHKADGKAEKHPFTSLEEILNSKDPVVVPGSVEQSTLNDVLQPDADKPMPPKSSGYSPLTPDEIKVIQDWIANGAKESLD